MRDSNARMADDPKSFLPPLRPVHWRDPLAWLASGLKDLRAAPGIGAFYGLCFWAMALVVAAVFRNMPEYTMSFVSGCFLVGPFLAMGLYESSRRREAGLPQDLGASAMRALESRIRCPSIRANPDQRFTPPTCGRCATGAATG